MNPTGKKVLVTGADGFIGRLWADHRKATRLLGWEPRYAGREGFKKGLAKTIQWFQDPENLKYYKADIYNI